MLRCAGARWGFSIFSSLLVSSGHCFDGQRLVEKKALGGYDVSHLHPDSCVPRLRGTSASDGRSDDFFSASHCRPVVDLGRHPSVGIRHEDTGKRGCQRTRPESAVDNGLTIACPRSNSLEHEEALSDTCDDCRVSIMLTCLRERRLFKFIFLFVSSLPRAIEIASERCSIFPRPLNPLGSHFFFSLTSSSVPFLWFFFLCRPLQARNRALHVGRLATSIIRYGKALITQWKVRDSRQIEDSSSSSSSSISFRLIYETLDWSVSVFLDDYHFFFFFHFCRFLRICFRIFFVVSSLFTVFRQVNKRKWSWAGPWAREEWHMSPFPVSSSPVDANVHRGSFGSPWRSQAYPTVVRVQVYPAKQTKQISLENCPKRLQCKQVHLTRVWAVFPRSRLAVARRSIDIDYRIRHLDST